MSYVCFFPACRFETEDETAEDRVAYDAHMARHQAAMDAKKPRCAVMGCTVPDCDGSCVVTAEGRR